MATKECFKCRETLPLSAFYKHPKMADGHLGKCKQCTKVDSRQSREARRDYYNQYDKDRSTPDRIKKMVEQRDPIKHKARVCIQNAVRRGKVAKKPCEVCGEAKVDAHHEDYSRPLDVNWLCRKHHGERHRSNL